MNPAPAAAGKNIRNAAAAEASEAHQSRSKFWNTNNFSQPADPAGLFLFYINFIMSHTDKIYKAFYAQKQVKEEDHHV